MLVTENITEAVPVLLSKLIPVAHTSFAKFPNEFSSASLPPTTLIFVPDTVPLNFAEPPLELDPIVIVVAATLPENVIIPGATVLALLIT